MITTLSADILGWIGSILLISAYVLISRGKITAKTPMYQWFNIIGSILLTINTIHHGAYPSSAVNIVWFFIGLYFLRRIYVNSAKAE